MKTKLFTLILFLVTLTTVNAQQISVVSPSNQTTLYTDLNEAINNADAGSILYLSGGSFQVSDNTKITKKLSIIGIGHRSTSDNVDGNTIIMGNLNFGQGSDGSVLTGIYSGSRVYIYCDNILIRYCRIDAIMAGNYRNNISINQNYVNHIDGAGSVLNVTNNIIHIIHRIDGGRITNNIIERSQSPGIQLIKNSIIKNNIILSDDCYVFIGSNNTDNIVSNNIAPISFGENCIVLADIQGALFVGPNNGVNASSNFHLKGSAGKNAGTDGTDIGIYGGETGFKDNALPPGPRIVSKKIGEQTDENGNLSIELTVTAE